ncbi:methyltransferase [Litorivivens sp.]|uniref:class I SAM-dependent methyltransferase n=1 Tax=Litorivivens sp. TaxID=2020868 RepID=UPI0035619B63
MANEDYYHVNDLIILKKKHSLIKHITEQLPTPEIHGTKVWGSSFMIMDYLKKHTPDAGSEILEIGCGWGLLSIFCAKHFDALVTATDADPHVFSFLDAHSIINEVEIDQLVARYEELKIKDLKGYELVLGGDICFWDELVDPLFSLVQKAVKAKVGKIIIADPGRPPFLELAKRCEEAFGGELLDWSITKPRKVDGNLLVVES